MRLQWAERTSGEDAGFPILFNAFQSTTRHGRLTSIKASLAGRLVYLRFKCTTGGRSGRVRVILNGRVGIVFILTPVLREFTKEA